MKSKSRRPLPYHLQELSCFGTSVIVCYLEASMSGTRRGSLSYVLRDDTRCYVTQPESWEFGPERSRSLLAGERVSSRTNTPPCGGDPLFRGNRNLLMPRPPAVLVFFSPSTTPRLGYPLHLGIFTGRNQLRGSHPPTHLPQIPHSAAFRRAFAQYFYSAPRFTCTRLQYKYVYSPNFPE